MHFHFSNLTNLEMNTQSEIQTKRKQLVSLYDAVYYVQMILQQTNDEIINSHLKSSILMLLCMINKIAPHMSGLIYKVMLIFISLIILILSNFIPNI